MESIFLTKFPIFDTGEHIYGFDIQLDYEESNKADFNLLIKKIYMVLSDADIIKRLQNKIGFINLSTDIVVFTDFTSLIPKDNFVIKVSKQQTSSKVFMDKLRELKNQGYRFCLTQVKDFDELAWNFPFDYVEIDLKDAINMDKEDLKKINDRRVLTIANEVNSYEELKILKNLGFDLFKGEFFTKPEKVETTVDNLSKLETLKLIRLVHEEDDLNTIAEYIKASPTITVNLLKYVNSSFFYLTNQITSVNRAVGYLGKKNLMNWLILLSMISVSNSDTKRELVKMAILRGKIMELLSKKINNDENVSDMAFIIGVLSFAESIFGTTIENVFRELNINQDLINDIKNQSGYFGNLLKLAKEIEGNKTKNIKKLSGELTIDPSEIAWIKIEAIKWSEDMLMVLH